MGVTETEVGITQDDKGLAKAPPEAKGGTPGEESKVSPEAPPHTKESEEKAVEDAVHKALSAAGRVSTDTAEAERLLNEAKTIRDSAQEKADEADRDAVSQDPEALKSVEERIRQRNEETKLANEKRELDSDKAKHQERLGKADKAEIKERATEIATKHNVDVESLIKFTDGSKEAMEELAQKLSGGKPPLKLVPGARAAGENWRDLSPTEKINRGLNKS